MGRANARFPCQSNYANSVFVGKEKTAISCIEHHPNGLPVNCPVAPMVASTTRKSY